MKVYGLLLFLFLLEPTIAIKLNYPRVLLPIFEKISINFTLEVIESGCFKWSSTRSDLIAITPLYDNPIDPECTSTAVVTTRSRERRRHTAVVLAEDLSTGEILRCDVIVDVIDQLGVLTTTRELYLEEAPETFELWAQDSQGNAFTTLEGIEFNWRILSQNQDDSNDWQQVLRFLRFSESKYHEVPASVKQFDHLGLRGSMVLLEGINTGAARVSVQLPHNDYSHVPSIEVDIMILANIILDPSDVHILVGDSISFRVLQLKQGKLDDITDNNQYYLEIEHTKLATINGNTVLGNALGRTSVVLKDRNVGKRATTESMLASSAPSPRASLTITRADKITVNLLPHYNWITVEGERHTIAIDLRTRDDQLITLGSKYEMSSQFDETIFYKLEKSVNGTQIYGEALKVGTSPVVGTYENLRAKAELLVYKAITLEPAKVVLPYDPNNTKRQKIQYTATGGDGSFAWASSNINIVSIAQSGLAETSLENIKELTADRSHEGVVKVAHVKVALQRNIKISKTAEILFLPPVKLEIIRYNFETTVKDYVFVHIALYAFHNKEFVPFTSCENLNFDYDFSHEIFYVDNNAKATASEKLHPNACRVVALRATTIGTSNLKVSYTFADRLLRDEVSLLVFDKLDILNPISNEVILPIGSSRSVIYYNGPQRVYNLAAELSSKMKIQKSIATATRLTNDQATDKHIFQILCKEVGETVFHFQIYNVLAKSNYAPYISEFKTQIFCVKPRFINLYTTEKLRDSCPLKLRNSLMHVKPNENNLEIAIEVLDAESRKLMNISSLIIDWKFTQLESGEHDDVQYRREIEEDIVSGVPIPKRDYLITSLPHIENNFKIKAIVTSYDKKVLDKFGITAEKPEFGIRKEANEPLQKPVIENELNFQAVNSSLLPFNDLAIFLSTNRVERVEITQGSGFYDIALSEAGIVVVEFDVDTRQLLVRPLRVGKVQVDLTDRCLVTEPNHLFVSVVSVGKIDVQVSDRVQVGQSIDAVVKLYDTFEDPLNLDYLSLEIYDLHEHIFNTNILHVTLGDQTDVSVGEVRYIIRGNELGETKIEFSSGFADKEISSAAASIQVFPPLRLLPRNSTIIIGSSLQIYSHGGPYPDVKIVYTVQYEHIASMDSSVLTAQRLGQTTVTGRCIGVNPINAQPVLYSEDTIQVFVVPLERVKIKTPLLRIRSGAIMPATIWGAPNISPMILGTLPTLSVTWATENSDIVDILGVFSDAGVEYADKDSISVRIKALNPGKAKIVATVITPNGRQSCSVEVIVFKMLELESPKRITYDAILVPPQSQINLKSNIPDATFKLAAESSSSIVRVSRDGILETSETLGRELIIASAQDQTLSIPIEVKNIHYILATLEAPTIKLRSVEPLLPSGMNLVLKVSLFDNLGNEFSHNLQDVNTLRNSLSRKDTVGINVGENFTISINLPRETSNMLAVSLKAAIGVKYESDYIKLAVGKSVNNFPTKKMFAVGDVICFDSPLASTSNWASSNDNIIRIDANLGIGTVIASGATFVEQVTITNGNIKNGFVAYDLEIRDADKIAFIKSSDVFNGENYRGHVLVRNHLQIDKTSNVVAKNATKCHNSIFRTAENIFTCHLHLIGDDNENVATKIIASFKINPIFDKSIGSYACEITLITGLSDLVDLVKELELNFELEARLKNGISAATHLKMVPAIHVNPKLISVDQIDTQIITISGLEKILQKITVTTSDSSALEITQTSKGHGSQQYKAKLLKAHPLDESLFVIINSPQSLQTIHVPITSPNIAQKCLNQPLQNMSSVLFAVISNLGLIISTLIVLAATVWAIIYCSPQQRQPSDGGHWFSSFFSKASSQDVEEFSPFRKKTTIPEALFYHPSNPLDTPRGPIYPPSPYFDHNRTVNTSPGSPNSSGAESPVYGDSTLVPPNKRINRRYI